MLKAVFFDLDGTLLPMDEKEFTKAYFHLISEKVKDYGYDKEKLIKTIYSGTEKMYYNDGKKTNEEVFWDFFVEVYGKEKLKDKAIFDDFYVHEFKNLKKCCGPNPLAKEIAKFVKDKGLISVLSTNPIFPYQGTMTRMGFVDLKEDDFDFITAYENSSFCKPNPKYFEVLLKKYNLKPEEVVLFGNNDVEDYLCAKKCGIECYLVGNNLILHEDLHLHFKHIKMEEIIGVIEKLCK